MTKDVLLTNEEAIKELNTFKKLAKSESGEKALDMAIKALKIEPLTDTEQRIFLAAMGREEKACKKVEEDLMVVCHSEEVGEDLVVVCKRIERKVKNALWK